MLNTEELEDMPVQFILRCKSWEWDGITWIMVRLGREVQYQTDYLLGTDQRLFHNTSIQDR